MIAIIAEKPSVGQDIARVIGATEKKNGYMAGNGYLVTWALGHLVSLAMPSAYGYGKASHEDLPMLPEPFQLVVRQIKTDRGMVTDIGAAKQLKVIDEVFSKCDSIIVATDAGREGELIFRYIYHYLGYTKPFKRLWISSLTDEAIRAGMSNLKNGEAYDALYNAADCRAKADWLVGMNASRALALASGMPNNSLGRVQTPTLAMICSRYKRRTVILFLHLIGNCISHLNAWASSVSSHILRTSRARSRQRRHTHDSRPTQRHSSRRWSASVPTSRHRYCTTLPHCRRTATRITI